MDSTCGKCQCSEKATVKGVVGNLNVLSCEKHSHELGTSAEPIAKNATPVKVAESP